MLDVLLQGGVDGWPLWTWLTSPTSLLSCLKAKLLLSLLADPGDLSDLLALRESVYHPASNAIRMTLSYLRK